MYRECFGRLDQIVCWTDAVAIAWCNRLDGMCLKSFSWIKSCVGLEQSLLLGAADLGGMGSKISKCFGWIKSCVVK